MALFLALVRSSTAIWAGPLAMALAIWYANNDAQWTPLEPYLTGRTAAGAEPLFLTLSVVAACAAWEGGRMRRAGWIGLPSARPPLIAVAPLLVPTLVAGIAALVSGLVWKLHLGGVGFVPDLRFLPTFLAITLSLVLFGFALGTLLPSAVAVPAMLIGVYSWMALPVIINDPIWPRYLSGLELESCCSIEFDVDSRALLAPIVVSAGIAAAAWLILLTRSSSPAVRMALLAAPLVLGIGGGAVVARDLGPYPELPRDPALLVCAEGTSRVCVWPEHLLLLPEASAIAAAAAAAWEPFSEVPGEFTEAYRAQLSPDVHYFATSVDADRDDIRSALAYSMIPPPPACADDQPITDSAGILRPPYQNFFVGDYVQAWFEATAGADSRYLAEEFADYGIPDGPGVAAVVDRVRALPIERQRAWLERNLAAIASCDVLPRIEP